MLFAVKGYSPTRGRAGARRSDLPLGLLLMATALAPILVLLVVPDAASASEFGIDGGAMGEVRTDAAGDVVMAAGIGGLTVVKLSGTGLAELWRYTSGPLGSSCDLGRHVHVAIDGNGDVVVVGTVTTSGEGSDMLVVKLSGTTGMELWSPRLIRGIAGGDDSGRAVALDGDGDVIAAGSTENVGSGQDFTVVKLSGTTGTEMWRAVISGSGSGCYDDVAQTVAVDAAGDVVAGGRIVGTYGDLIVIKLSGLTGGEVWRNVIPSGRDFTAVEDVAVDGIGDVVAAGTGLTPANPDWTELIAVKYSGVSGTELWRTVINGRCPTLSADFGNALAINGAGDVAVAGAIEDACGLREMLVVKLAGATGSEIWGTTVRDAEDAFGLDVAFDPGGDVVGGGYSTGLVPVLFPYHAYDRKLQLLKLAGETGRTLWHRILNRTSTGDESARSVTVDAAGDVIGGFNVYNSNWQGLAVLKLCGASGLDAGDGLCLGIRKARVRLGGENQDSFAFDGMVDVASSGNGVVPDAEPVTLEVGDSGPIVLAPGSFERIGDKWKLRDGASPVMKRMIIDLGRHRLKASSARSFSLTGTVLPLEVSLSIGDDQVSSRCWGASPSSDSALRCTREK